MTPLPNPSLMELLLVLLNGSHFATAIRRSEKPCRIVLPPDPHAVMALVDAHLCGRPATLTFIAEGYPPRLERVDQVVLAAYCPGTDGLVRWLAIDLDAADHGATGLADPAHAARCIAERADAAGLSSGLLVARSRRALGRHVFFFPPGPVDLETAVIGAAGLAAAAFNIAVLDAAQCAVPHAFLCANGAIARLGDAGSVELVPRSTSRPPHGWSMTLPCAGAFAAHGGGVIVDPFEDKPTQLEGLPACDPQAWEVFTAEARAALARRTGDSAHPRRQPPRFPTPALPIERIHPATREFIEGRVPEGARNQSAFAAAANLLGCGVDEREAERLIVAGAAACGLPKREARSAFASALKSVSRNVRLA